MAFVILDRQHVGKPSHDETGAWGDFDKDGKPDIIEQEAVLTGWYGLHCEMRLRELGHRVMILGDGSYSERHARVGKYGADVYIAMHLNAGGGEYASTFYDSRSKAGKSLAETIVSYLVSATGVKKGLSRETSPTAEFSRPFVCIAGIYPTRAVACLIEPLFLDNPSHQLILNSPDGLKRLGVGLADGIHQWIQGR